MTALFVITRAVHFGSCLLFFGAFAFDWIVAPALSPSKSGIADDWRACLRFFSPTLLPIIFISGIAWLALVAATMSGQPPGIDILKIVWSQTQFGTVWKIRLIILMFSTLVAFCFLKSRLQKIIARLQMLLGGCLVGSLAWAGHGQESSPWHLLADILHLLGAGIWPAGLLPLFIVLRQARRINATDEWHSIALLVRRFSSVSLVAVSLLVITGLINSWFLVGSLSNLFGQPYGQWLLAKVTFFCITLIIASVNLLRLKPRLFTESSQPEKAALTVAQLQTNVQIELFLGLAIIVIVAILGILPPAIH
jgi:copper resistance protein D